MKTTPSPQSSVLSTQYQAVRSSFLNATVGEYRLIDFLGAGGMGEVFRATHLKIGRVAAIKILTEATSGGEFVERFFNEARIQASLQHPNIATLYDFLEYQGKPCIVMEYVDGVTIADHLKHHGALPLVEAVRVFKAVAGAIGYIHQHGVIHRDIKSNNVKISARGEVKLLDFGIAKNHTSRNLTLTGGVIGTPNYLSPEQLRGLIADARTDIWALGVLFYEMVTGQLPFEATTLGELCDKIGSVKYQRAEQINPSVPREVENIIARCLRKNPAERYQSAGELAQHVERLDLAAAPRTPPAPRRAANRAPQEFAVPVGGDSTAWLKKNWKLGVAMAALCAVVTLFAAGAGLLWYFNSGGTAVESGQAEKPLPVNAAAQNAPRKTVTIDIDEGRADVYLNAEKVGTTPYEIDAQIGERYNILLRREGYVDKPVDLHINPNKRYYTIYMNRK